MEVSLGASHKRTTFDCFFILFLISLRRTKKTILIVLAGLKTKYICLAGTP